MACPTRRKGSDNWYYRRTIPADVRPTLQKLAKEHRPRGWYKTHISISLGTAERTAAKAKCAEVAAAVERHLKALREGPKPLTAKQIAGLSGIAYRAFAEGLENNPGLTAKAWLQVAESNEAAKRGNPLTIAKNDTERRAISMCAYSGARVAEMIQLRKEDVRKDKESWVIRLTPEAGGIKTNHFRGVPVHEHFLSLGFVEFLKQSKTGPLFCDVGKDGTTAGPADGVYSRIREAVRRVVPDPRVQPNHAWRYTFKTYGHEAGLNELTLDAICGHSARTKGKDYTKVTLKKRMDAMASFPRYRLAETARSATA